MTPVGGLGGGTLIWTEQGLMTIEALARTSAPVMLHRVGGTIFEDVEVVREPPGPAVVITVGRKTTKTFVTSTDQPWRVRVRSSDARTESVPVAAKDLFAGQRLLTIRPRSRLGKVTPSPFGVAAGIVFGDGCRPRSRDAAEVTLHGPKRQLVRFFQGCRLTTLPSGSIHITGLPGSFKSMIDLREGSSALYGWLAGYVATDGTISARGQVSLSSSRWEHLEFARTVATQLGIGVGDITTHFRVGLGRPEATALHTLRLQQPPLDLLVREDQRNRWRSGASAVPSWTVRAIERQPAAPLWQLRTSSPASVVLDGYLVLPAGRRTGGASA